VSLAVCGEACDIQKCVECLKADEKKDIVDFIMQRTLEDVDLSSNDISERLITLDCGHVFTVETLDGHCNMNEYYEIDAMGKFLSLKAPPVEYKLPPLCPSCRGPITSKRYGRVIKRAILDVLEQNVASTMSRSLESLNPALERISTNVPTFQERAGKIKADLENVSEASNNRPEVVKGGFAVPLAVSQLDRSAMHNFHGISPEEAKAWHGVVDELLQLYKKAHAVASSRGAHVQAYEAAVTTLYRLQLDAIMENPQEADTSEGPEPRAIAAARRDVGQPPHKADSKFQVEAFHRTLELRFMIAQIAQSRIDALPSTLTDEKAIQHRELWVSFADFVLESCVEDAKKALSMAEQSSASRQAAHCSVYVIRSEFERERFKAVTAEKKLPSISYPQGRSEREQLASQVDARRRTINADLARLKVQYLLSRPAKTLGDMQAEQDWFANNCHRKVDKFLNELTKLADYIRKGGSYEALSMQEMEDIVKAFDFGLS
jgi:hypothetical protein